MDRIRETVVAALKQALAGPAENRLFKSGKLEGLFPGRGGVAGEAAAQALRDGLLEVVRSETRGKTTIEWVRLSPAGVDFLHQSESPVRALEDLRTVLRLNQQAVPVWLEEMRAGLRALDERLAADAQGWQQRLEALTRRVDETLRRIEQMTPPLPADVARDFPWAVEAINYLDRRKGGGPCGDCPLPELFAALCRRHPDLTLGVFHDGLRCLQEGHALRLLPADGAGMAQPEFALLDGEAVLYRAAR
jgi:hypothetical protein